MNAPLPSNNPPPSAFPSQAPQHPWLKVISIIVVLLVVVGVGILLFWKNDLSHFFQNQKSNSVLLYVSPFPTYSLQAIDITKSSSQLQPVQDSQIGSSTIIDMASDGSARYLLLLSSDKSTTNLYRESTTSGNTSLTQLTHSPTLKWHLVYDAPSHTFLYQSVVRSSSTTISARQLMLFNSATSVEKSIGSETNPSILPGGIMVLAQDGIHLSVINTVSGKVIFLLSVPHATYALSSDGHSLAVYNPIGKTFDTYDIHNVTSASYVSSIQTPFPPVEAVFVGSKLLELGQVGTSTPAWRLQYVGDASSFASMSLAGDLEPSEFFTIHL